MEKRFKLTIDLKAIINEELQGLGTWKSMQHTRQFMDKVKADKDTLLEYYKFRAFDNLKGAFGCEHMEGKPEVKDEKEIFLSLLTGLPRETASYILKVLTSNHNWDWKTEDRNSSLIYNQFGALEITGAHFREIEPGKDEKS